MGDVVLYVPQAPPQFVADPSRHQAAMVIGHNPPPEPGKPGSVNLKTWHPQTGMESLIRMATEGDGQTPWTWYLRPE